MEQPQINGNCRDFYQGKGRNIKVLLLGVSLLSMYNPTIRSVSQIIGVFISYIIACNYGNNHIKLLKSGNLRAESCRGKYERKMVTSKKGIMGQTIFLPQTSSPRLGSGLGPKKAQGQWYSLDHELHMEWSDLWRTQILQ